MRWSLIIQLYFAITCASVYLLFSTVTVGQELLMQGLDFVPDHTRGRGFALGSPLDCKFDLVTSSLLARLGCWFG